MSDRMIRRRPGGRLLPLLCLGSVVVRVANAQTISGVQADSPSPLHPDDMFVVSWTLTPADGEPLTTGDLKVYEITLEECADGAGTCSCEAGGVPDGAVSLCVDDDSSPGCVDSDGSYDLQVPPDTTPGVYVVRVSLVEDPGVVFGCSYGFGVEEPEEEEEEPGLDVNEAAPGVSLEVESGLSALPGEPFTARWMYDDGSREDENGVGGSAGDFAVDLYSCEGLACVDGR